MGRITRWMDERLYRDYRDNWDDWLFRDRILAALTPEAVVLDLGAGAGIVPQMDMRGHAARICGVDLDPRVLENPYLDDGRIADAGHIPYDDATFDLIFSDNVFEHLDDPATVLRECARVLKPGGRVLFKTPNKHHYMPTIARMTPHSFHGFVNRLRGRATVDTFPTRYRANTVGAVRRLAAATGFTVEGVDLVEGRPEYLRINPLTYLVGLAYERTVNRFEALKGFRILLIAKLRKS
jgi:SAM-dependent methyltransferase